MERTHYGILFSYIKKLNPVICITVDGAGEHCVKWNKPVTKWQESHYSAHIWSLKNITLMEVRIEQWSPEHGKSGDGAGWSAGVKLHWKMRSSGVLLHKRTWHCNIYFKNLKRKEF